MAAPAPDKATTTESFDALLVTDMDPVKVPTAVGANTTVKVELLPAAMVTGIVGWVRVNWGAEKRDARNRDIHRAIVRCHETQRLTVSHRHAAEIQAQGLIPRLPVESFCCGGEVADFPPALKP